MRRAALPSAIVIACLTCASVAGAAPGVAMRWNHCFGEGTGEATRVFACDTNVGLEELVGSFELVEDLVNVSGNEIVVDISTSYPSLQGSGPPLPEWWKMRNAGTCRQAAMNAVFVADPANQVCLDRGQ